MLLMMSPAKPEAAASFPVLGRIGMIAAALMLLLGPEAAAQNYPQYPDVPTDSNRVGVMWQRTSLRPPGVPKRPDGKINQNIYLSAPFDASTMVPYDAEASRALRRTVNQAFHAHLRRAYPEAQFNGYDTSYPDTPSPRYFPNVARAQHYIDSLYTSVTANNGEYTSGSSFFFHIVRTGWVPSGAELAAAQRTPPPPPQPPRELAIVVTPNPTPTSPPRPPALSGAEVQRQADELLRKVRAADAAQARIVVAKAKAELEAWKRACRARGGTVCARTRPQ